MTSNQSKALVSPERLGAIYEAGKKGVPQQLTVRDVAAVTGLSISLMNKLRREGGGPKFKKFGKSVRYDLNDVTEWLNRDSYSTVAESRNQN